jgi:transposase-like protein
VVVLGLNEGDEMTEGSKVTREQEALLDELLKGCESAEQIVGKNGLLEELQKRLMERALEGELTEHLGYEAHAAAGRGSGNSRNGRTKKRVQTSTSEFEIEVPRDRGGTFEPQLVKKRQRRLAGFDEKVIALYARGQTTREIQRELEELYGVEVSASLISRVTDAVLEDARSWQGRPLQSCYPIVYFDALFVKSRQEGVSCFS